MIDYPAPPLPVCPSPPSPLRGTRLPAGLGWSTVYPDLDFETYSEAGYVWDDQANRWTGPPGAPKQTRGLPLVGAEPYVRHHTFRIVWLSYDLKDGLGKRRWRPGLPPPADLLSYLAAGGIVEAHNAGFERWIWELHCVPKLGWPAVDERQWRCSASKARASALPGSLGKLGEVLGISDQKDKRGVALMKLLSMPRQPTQADPRRVQLPIYDQTEEARRATEIIVQACMREPGMSARKAAGVVARAAATAREEAEETEAYGQYCDTDIVAESQVSALLPDLEGLELEWWITHERINRRGVHIDKIGVQNCISVVEQVFAKYNVELQAITGIDAASKVEQLQGWLRGRGTYLDSLDEEAVEGALKDKLLPPDVRRVLEIRAAAGSASVKKLYAIQNRLSWDDRLRDLYIYHGARTGRSTGEGPQPTNLPKAGPDMARCGLWVKNEFQADSGCKRYFGQHRMSCPFCNRPTYPKPRVEEWNPAIAEEALAEMATRSLEWIELVYGEALPTVAGCLRALFDAAPGHDLISTDYNSIEAVGLAMLAGEQWRIKVFNSHGKIYEASASTMFSVPLDEILGWKKLHDQHHPLRAKGKIAELACLAPDTQVLTLRGYVRIVDVRCNDTLWDGAEWVSHAGVVFKGRRPVIDLGGARMTQDHLVLCGTSWLEASRVASSASTRCQALATASATLSSLARLPRVTESGCSALVAPSLTTPCSPTSGMAERRGARPAGTDSRAAPSSSTSNTPVSSQTTNIDDACSIDSLRLSDDATDPTIQPTRTMGLGASTSSPRGAETRACSCSTSSPCRGGTTPRSTWTDETSTDHTAQATSVSSRGQSTRETSEPWPTSSAGSATLSDVYDIAHAGPRNRFTIRTTEGHLIVHNCGYQGWIGSAKAFDAPGTDDELKEGILLWRAASPTIEWLWGGQEMRKAAVPVRNALAPGYDGTVADWALPLAQAERWDRSTYYFGVEGMAVLSMLEQNVWHSVTRLDGTDSGIAFMGRGETMYCRIPSGRILTYHRTRLTPSDRGGFALSYEGWNTNPKNGPKGWIRMGTWGGRLVENINQATCREILRAACLVLEQHGYPVVLHIYDEIVAEIREGVGSIEEFERLVTEGIRHLIQWAHDWPIRAPGGYRAKRYRKG